MDAKQAEEIKDIAVKSNEAIKVLREEHDKGSKGNAEAMQKANDALDALEVKNQEFTKLYEAEKTASAEMKEQLDDVEKKLSRMSHSEGKGEKSAEYKASMNMILKGVGTPDEMKLLRTDSASDGGVLVHNEISMEMLRDITEISPMRSIARISRTSSKALELPRRTAGMTAYWVGERETVTKSTSKYGDATIPVNKLMAQADATREMLEDSSTDVASEIMTDASEAFAVKEGNGFVLGDAVKKPQGFMTNGDVGEINSGSAALITADSIIQLAGELKTGYNPVYVLNRKTIVAIRLLQTSDNQYLWQAGMTGGNPNTLNGFNYIEMPDMADVAANAYPVAFGDFRKGYRIVDGAGMTVIRDDLTQAGDDEIIWTFRRRVGGQVVIPEAIKKLKIAV